MTWGDAVLRATQSGGRGLAEMLREQLGPNVCFGLVVWLPDPTVPKGVRYTAPSALYVIGSVDQAIAALTELRDSARATD